MGDGGGVGHTKLKLHVIDPQTSKALPQGGEKAELSCFHILGLCRIVRYFQELYVE